MTAVMAPLYPRLQPSITLPRHSRLALRSLQAIKRFYLAGFFYREVETDSANNREHFFVLRRLAGACRCSFM